LSSRRLRPLEVGDEHQPKLEAAARAALDCRLGSRQTDEQWEMNRASLIAYIDLLRKFAQHGSDKQLDAA